MKLYDVQNNCKVRIIDTGIKIPVASLAVKTGDIIQFYHIDGMYSLCKNENDDVVHIAAWTEVELV